MAQYFYVVGRIYTDTSAAVGYGPDVQVGTAYNGSWHPPSNTYLICTPAEVEGLTPLTDQQLSQECANRFIEEAAVRTWLVHVAASPSTALDLSPE